ncbi:MAG: hypothetical protein ACRCTQ_03505 [Brevinemataceae bacterium]
MSNTANQQNHSSQETAKIQTFSEGVSGGKLFVYEIKPTNKKTNLSLIDRFVFLLVLED